MSTFTLNSRHRFQAEDPEKPFFTAQDLDLQRTVFIKRLSVPEGNAKETDRYLKAAMREIRTMILFENEHLPIPKIYDAVYEEKNRVLWVIMEYIPGETLRECTTDSISFLRYMKELTDILLRMEKRHLYHKDIKPENLIRDRSGRLWLIDFGISADAPNMYDGTGAYKAPEMDFGSKYTDRSRVDVFSIGVMLFEHFAGTLPRIGRDYWHEEGNTWEKFTEPKELAPEISKELNDLIVKCMRYDPRRRPSLFELKNTLYRMR